MLKKKGIQLVLFFLLSLLFFATLVLPHQNTNSMDALFHMRLAHDYGTRGIFTDFPWMYFSIARDYWADHHFLYHLLLIPFTKGDLFAGMQWSSIVFSSLAVSSCVAYCMAHKVRYPLLYGMVLLSSSSHFLFRISMPRAMTLCVVLLMLALWLFEKEKDWMLAPLAFVFVWTYQTAVVLLPMACCAILIRGLQYKRWNGKPLLWSGLGLGLGLSIHPFFPSTWKFTFFHLLSGHIQTKATIGLEWHALSGADLFLYSFPAFCMTFFVPLYFLKHRRDWPQDIALVGVGSFVLFVASFRANRMLEYAVPFGVVMGARIVDGVFFQASEKQSWKKSKIFFLFVFFGFLAVGFQYHRSVSQKAFDITPQNYKKVSQWLIQNTPARSIVFHTSWDAFPYLYFHNSHNYYITGLNPHFLLSWNESLYKKYKHIGAGLSKDPVTSIQQSFSSRWVVLFARREEMRLMLQLEGHPLAKRVYSDPFVRVYKLQQPLQQKK